MKHGHVDSLNTTPVRPGVVRRVFSGDGATLAFTTMEPGHQTTPHSHPHEQIEYLLEGRMRFVADGEETILERGGLLVVPPGVEHYGETLGDEPVVALSVFSPRRDEYAAEEEGAAR
jgi:quercetin dioxygenase-like cupin family protein